MAHHVIEVAAGAMCRRLNLDLLSRGDRVQCTALYLPRNIRLVRGYLPKFRYMQILQGPTTMARPHIAGRSVAPFQLFLVILDQTNVLTHLRRCAQIRGPDFLQLKLGVVERVVDDARCKILTPYTMISNINSDLCRETYLPGLHDDVEQPLVSGVLGLRCPAAIRDYLSLFVNNLIEAVHAAIAVGKPHHQLFVSARTLEDGDRLGHRNDAASTNANVAPEAQLT